MRLISQAYRSHTSRIKVIPNNRRQTIQHQQVNQTTTTTLKTTSKSSINTAVTTTSFKIRLSDIRISRVQQDGKQRASDILERVLLSTQKLFTQ